MAAAGVHGGLGPLLLTLDPGTPAEHAQHRAAFAGRDLVVDPARMRNLFDEAADAHGGAAAWLRDAAHPGEPDPALEYRPITDAAARPVVGLPVIAGDPDWHVTTAPIAVYDERGRSPASSTASASSTGRGSSTCTRKYAIHGSAAIIRSTACGIAAIAESFCVCENRALWLMLFFIWKSSTSRAGRATPARTRARASSALSTRRLAR